MLRVNRLYGPDERLRKATAFTQEFGAGDAARTISRSRVSRWETGQDRVRFEVIRRYEEVLGLPRHRLVSVVDLLYRQATSAIGAPVLARPTAAPDTLVVSAETLLDKVFSDDRMTGGDWDRLTCDLLAFDVPLLYPRRRWHELAERLLAELIIAEGGAWLTRFEAAKRLFAIPSAADALVEACGALVSDPTCQVVIEPLSLLDSTNRPAANQYVLDQLCNPVSERALRGALLACVSKTRRRHFSPGQLRRLVATALELVADKGATSTPEVRHLGSEILRATLASGSEAARARLRAAIAGDRTLHHILEFGRTVPPQPAQHVVNRVVTTANTWLPEAPVGHDPILTTLLTELLFSPNCDVRLEAAQVIAATPYREPVGSALVAELRRPPAEDGAARAPIIGALAQLGRREDLAVVQRLLLTPGVPVDLTETAAWTVGHLCADPGEAFFARALRHHGLDRGDDPTESNDAVLRGLIYGAGLRRHDGLLACIRDGQGPATARSAARWWLDRPAHIRDSAASS